MGDREGHPGWPGGSPGDGVGPRGMMILQRDPDNLEPPFSALDGFLTPVDRFHVRSHFDVPRIEAAS